MVSFTDLINFSQSDLDKAAKKIVSRHILQIKSGIDAFGKKFKPYSVGYSRKKAGKKFKDQISTKVSPPDLTLTGEMLKKFNLISTRHTGELQIKYGIKDKKQGGKLVENNATRVVAGGNRVGPKTQKEVLKMFADNLQKNAKRLSRQRIKIKW
mgnify:FL=1